MQRGLWWKDIFAVLTLSYFRADIALSVCSQPGKYKASLGHHRLVTPLARSFTEEGHHTTAACPPGCWEQLQSYSPGKSKTKRGWQEELGKSLDIAKLHFLLFTPASTTDLKDLWGWFLAASTFLRMWVYQPQRYFFLTYWLMSVTFDRGENLKDSNCLLKTDRVWRRDPHHRCHEGERMWA